MTTKTASYKVASIGITGTLRHLVDAETQKPVCDSKTNLHARVYNHLKSLNVTCKCCRKFMSKHGVGVL